MSEIKKISFEDESPEIKEKVKSYWSKRSEDFLHTRETEINSEKAALWKEEIISRLEAKQALSILDAGCGTGYFEAILSPLGHEVIGIDLTKEMIDQGRMFLKKRGVTAKLMVMDAEHPDFEDGSFDAIISRNLTWTLPHPIKAYESWYKLLAPGGHLLIFDAEYAKGYHYLDQKTNYAHRQLDDETKEACHEIYHMLSISSLDRPDWDVEVLKGIGFIDVEADRSVGDRLYAKEDELYVPDRMFCVYGRKKL